MFKFIITPEPVENWNFHCVELSGCNMSNIQAWDGKCILHFLVGDVYLGHDLTWKMAQVISPGSTYNAQCSRGRGSVGPTGGGGGGLRSTYVNAETCKASEDAARRVPSHTQSVFRQFTASAPHRLCSLFRAGGHRVNLRRTHSCPFIYSTLLNVKNQFCTADSIPATLH